MNISAIILAAGQSARMGRVKALLPLPLSPGGGECSALAGLARLYRGLGVADILVVTGFHADEVEAECARLGLTAFRNPRPEDGMFSSVRAGLAALLERGAPEAVFVHPVDVPLVRPLALKMLMETAAAGPGGKAAPVLVPLFAGREGHPPLIPGVHLRRILAYDGEGGLRGAQAGLPRRVVSVADALILEDMDRPEDYERLRDLAARRDALSPEEAWVLLRQHAAADKILRHSGAVAEVAARFAEALPHCDPELARAGALLHDIKKGAPHHDRAGGDLLEALALPRLADIARSHLDLDLPGDAPITERELVYLADKYCGGAAFTPLEGRYEERLRQYANDAEATAAINARLERARKLEARLERETGEKPADLARQALAK